MSQLELARELLASQTSHTFRKSSRTFISFCITSCHVLYNWLMTSLDHINFRLLWLLFYIYWMYGYSWTYYLWTIYWCNTIVYINILIYMLAHNNFFHLRLLDMLLLYYYYSLVLDKCKYYILWIFFAWLASLTSQLELLTSRAELAFWLV